MFPKIAPIAFSLAALTAFSFGCTGNGPIAPKSPEINARFIHHAANGYSAGKTVFFDASDSTDTLFDILSYAWTWGDGTPDETFDNPLAQHVFKIPAAYSVELTVTDQAHESASVTIAIVINPPGTAPTACFSYESPNGWQPGKDMIFDASCSSDPDNDPLTYNWDWGDGAPGDPESTPIAHHSFQSEGNHDVRVVVRDGTGWSSSSEIRTIPIGYPLQPHAVSSIQLSSAVNDLEMIGNHIYLSTEECSLQILEISPTQELSAVGRAFSKGAGQELEIRGDYAYVAEAPHTFLGGCDGFVVFNISDPHGPFLQSTFRFPDVQNNARSLAISDGYAFVVGYVIYGIFDLSVPAAPRPLSFDEVYTDSRITIGNNHAYVGVVDPQHSTEDPRWIHITDISSPLNPIDGGSLYAASDPVDLFATDKILYLLRKDEDLPYDRSVLEIFDISAPTSPVSVGELKTSGVANGVYALGDYAYVADSSSDLTIVDASNPASPKMVAYADVPRMATHISVYGNYAAVASLGWQGYSAFCSLVRLW